MHLESERLVPWRIGKPRDALATHRLSCNNHVNALLKKTSLSGWKPESFGKLRLSEIPQSLGGGRPMQVELLISAEALPETAEFRSWRASEGEQRSQDTAQRSRR